MPRFVIYGSAGMLLLALAPMPYGYYTLLRLVATGVFIWAAMITSERRLQALPWVFSVLALLFNPLVKVPLSREVWALVDLGSAVLMLAAQRSLVQRS